MSAPAQFSSSSSTADEVRRKLGLPADWTAHVAVVLGSGLGPVSEQIAGPDAPGCELHTLKGFPAPSAEGHRGRIIAARVGRLSVLILQGRVHAYEGRTPDQVLAAVRLAGSLGIRKLILTNASGGIRDGFGPGHWMLIEDHVRLWANSFPWESCWEQKRTESPDGTPGMQKRIWCPHMLSLARTVPSKFPLHQGVYAMVPGPCYETPSEVRALRMMGADAVGMSTVPEAIWAAHRGIQVLGLSCITNVASGLTSQKLNHQEVTLVAGTVATAFAHWLRGFLQTLEED